MQHFERNGPQWRNWIRQRAREILGPGAPVAALVLVAILFIAASFTVLLPETALVHTSMKVLRYNDGAVQVNSHARGCGAYWDTRRVGHFVGATIQLAAGFCWNGKKVWWTWGLLPSNCYPVATAYTRVHMTCRIEGGNNSPLHVLYQAQVESSMIPLFSRTVTLELMVTPQGYVLQLPFQPI